MANGDMFAVGRVGNNKGTKRATEYLSKLYIEPQFSEPSHSISKINSLPIEDLLRDFKQVGTKVGRRQKTLFALGLHLKCRLGRAASIGAIRGELLEGSRLCGVQEKEFGKTLRNIMKSAYAHPFSLSKLRKWGLIERTGRPN
ncbi:MAG: hypothetical protein IH823_08830 [Candidatus Dadabacteria bacterium]|nr:hypothetical protein [Candidatus Dadabacteria bacterium]